MNIGQAVEALKEGHRVRRAGWTAIGMRLMLVGAHDGDTTRIPNGHPVRSHVVLKDAEEWVVPWNASQTDLLATDWEVVPPPLAA